MGARGTERSELTSVLGGPTQGMTQSQGHAQSSYLDFSLRASVCVDVGLPRLLPLLASSSLVCTSRSLVGGWATINAVSVATNSLAWYGPRNSEKTGLCNCIAEGSLAPSWLVASFGDLEQGQKVIMLEHSKHSSQDTRTEDGKTMSFTCLMPRALPRPSLQSQAPLDTAGQSISASLS